MLWSLILVHRALVVSQLSTYLLWWCLSKRCKEMGCWCKIGCMDCLRLVLYVLLLNLVARLAGMATCCQSTSWEIEEGLSLLSYLLSIITLAYWQLFKWFVHNTDRLALRWRRHCQSLMLITSLVWKLLIDLTQLLLESKILRACFHKHSLLIFISVRGSWCIWAM